jgi:hypothetical protein
MEGHRFFDPVRWGVTAETINKYLKIERDKREYLRGASFKEGVSEYFRIREQKLS